MKDSCKPTLELENFTPYILSVVASRVSKSLASNYVESFDLSIPEWRILAVLNRYEPLSAAQLCVKTNMDKVAVSRALNRLTDRKRIKRDLADEDRRRSVLRLSHTGRQIYQKIEPLALGYQNELLATLSTREQEQLTIIMNKLLAHTAGD